jgi:DNA-binding NtrC family response regulator
LGKGLEGHDAPLPAEADVPAPARCAGTVPLAILVPSKAPPAKSADEAGHHEWLMSARVGVIMTSFGVPTTLQQDAPRRILVADDEALVRRAVARYLAAAGYEVETFENAADVIAALGRLGDHVDLLLADVLMPGMTGFELLSEAHARWPDLAIVLMTGEATVAAAVEAIRLGAYDYLVKPVDPENTLIPAVRRAMERKRLVERNRFLESRLTAAHRVQNLVGDSEGMRRVCAMISAAAATDVTVLVLGESGTGKELVARAVHEQSTRGGRSLVDINCAALTESLLESELFGHVRGAFTGAAGARRGLFETASGGTLFLDEVGELSPTTQARLLRVLQEGVVRPVGSSESRRIDTRIIAATNRDLTQEVEANRFRQDLYYRLNVFPIEIPPLRERRDDIPVLVDHFLDKHSQRMSRAKPHLAAEALDVLMGHDWPGNARELENVCERALVLCRGPSLSADLLPRSIGAGRAPEIVPFDPQAVPTLAEARDAFVKSYVRRVVVTTNGNLAEAARLAGMDPSNFRRMVKRLEEGGPSED